MSEIASAQSVSKLRKFFVTIACCCNPISLKQIWIMFKESLCEDYLQKKRVSRWDFTFALNDSIRTHLLTELDHDIITFGGRPLSSHGISFPSPTPTNSYSALQNELRSFVPTDESKFCLNSYLYSMTSRC